MGGKERVIFARYVYTYIYMTYIFIIIHTLYIRI